MTTYVPQLPVSVDPLIAEAKQRARRRRLLAAAAVLLAAAATVATILATRPPSSVSPAAARRMQDCGILGIGLSWDVHASASAGCAFGTQFMTRYFAHAHGPASLGGFACSSRLLPDAAHIRCVAGTRVVLARSEGY